MSNKDVNPIKYKIAKAFADFEVDYRLSVLYMMIHPNDIKNIRMVLGIGGDDVNVWNARIIISDIHDEGIVLLCSMLFMEEPPLYRNQITKVVHLGDNI